VIFRPGAPGRPGNPGELLKVVASKNDILRSTWTRRRSFARTSTKTAVPEMPAWVSVWGCVTLFNATYLDLRARQVTAFELCSCANLAFKIKILSEKYFQHNKLAIYLYINEILRTPWS
jgi:uroporphyrinogen-III decarboxylase